MTKFTFSRCVIFSCFYFYLISFWNINFRSLVCKWEISFVALFFILHIRVFVFLFHLGLGFWTFFPWM